jgi:hypothetical protein
VTFSIFLSGGPAKVWCRMARNRDTKAGFGSGVNQL